MGWYKLVFVALTLFMFSPLAFAVVLKLALSLTIQTPDVPLG